MEKYHFADSKQLRKFRDELDVVVIERAEKYADEILKILIKELREFYPELTIEMDLLSKRIPKTLIVATNTTEANEIANNLKRISSNSLPNTDMSKLVRVAHYKVDNALSEIEQFPGLIYRMMEPKVVILMFASGKLVCTGAKTEKEVYDAVYKLKKILEDNQLITYVTSR